MVPVLLTLGASLCLISLIYIALHQHRKDVLARLGLSQLNTTEIYSPSKSLTPEKQGLSDSNAPPSPPTYSDVFPPHRRQALADLPPDAMSGRSDMSATQASALPPDYSKLTPDKAVCDSDDLLGHTTATGFTVEEIKRLGDFPDYATLSGVPLPQPYREFDIRTAKPRPYRPLRWAYHQTMSLMKLEPDWWLELHSIYADVVKQRQELYEKFGESTLRALPGSEIATKELMEMALQFLCARYPQYFTLSNPESTSTSNRPTHFHNSILNTTTDLLTTPPLFVLLHNIPEDFAIMLRDPDTGTYSFRAGIIMSSLGWNLGTKIGKQLHEIHGPVPDYREKMQFSMDRFFAKMPTDKPIQRGSWGLEIDEPLYAPPGPETDELTANSGDPSHTIDRVHFRVDWQTLRRLPLSGAIVFNFKGLFTPVTEFRTEPYIPSLVLKVLREGKENLKEYKHCDHTERLVMPAMEAFEREQIERGMVEGGWEEHTLQESPFFPGWEQKWHEQQGF